MSTVREYVAVDPAAGRRRAYSTRTVAEMANVTAKTVTLWVSENGSTPPAPLRGWAPRSDGNPTGRWLIDADLADQAFGRSHPDRTTDPEMLLERQRLADERAVLDLERRLFESSRLEQLENDNARLRAENDSLQASNEKLSLKVAKLSSVIRDLADTTS